MKDLDVRARPTIHYTEGADLATNSPIYRESQALRRALPRLLAEGHEGRFALVKGDDILEVFATLEEAARVGYEKFGNEAFLVQPIREWEELIRLPWYCWPCRT
jgi:hypothetical protein